jgi:tartrate dehydrogenase/decarboxylase / D-malate dehydrogenase
LTTLIFQAGITLKSMVKMLPDNWKDQIGGHDALYFGAVGWPAKIADHVSLWGSLLLFRREFDQYINLRPARLMPGIIAPVVRRDGSRSPAGRDRHVHRAGKHRGRIL